MSEAACECLQRSFRPLVRSDAGTSSSGTGLWPFATQTFPRRPGIETHPATESARCTPHRRPRTGTTRRIPVAYVGNPRRPQDVFVLRPASLHTTSCAYESEVDSPLPEYRSYFSSWFCKSLACSPKPDPYVMRVSRGPEGRKETLDEEATRKAAHAGTDHPQVA
jgi:hypothetical protein